MAIGVSILCILNYTVYLPPGILFLVVGFLIAPVLAPGPGILSSVRFGIRAGLRERLRGVFGVSKSKQASRQTGKQASRQVISGRAWQLG